MAAKHGWPLVAEDVMLGTCRLASDLLQRATRSDFSNYLAEDILVKVDRASMLSSLEVRAPLLDYRLIEFAFGKVPSRLKATPREKKTLPKRLTMRLLPPEFDRQRKQGFSIPLANWLRVGAFRELFHEVLLDPQAMFDRRTVRGLLSRPGPRPKQRRAAVRVRPVRALAPGIRRQSIVKEFGAGRAPFR